MVQIFEGMFAYNLYLPPKFVDMKQVWIISGSWLIGGWIIEVHVHSNHLYLQRWRNFIDPTKPDGQYCTETTYTILYTFINKI